MLVDIFRDLHALVETDNLSIDKLNSWAESFCYFDYQPSFWIIELIGCSSKKEAIKVLIDAKWQYGYSSYDYWEAYAGFSYIAYIDKGLEFNSWSEKLSIKLDELDAIDSISIPRNKEDSELYWSDLRRLEHVCRANCDYLFQKKIVFI